MIIEIVKKNFPDALADSHAQHGDETLIVKKEHLLEVMRFLRDDPQTDFNFLIDLTAVDCMHLDKPHRFETVYHLFSLDKKRRLRVKAPVDIEDCVIDSIVSVWKAADWMEREVWDLYGIKFRGHPNLKRILMYEEFEGHPLRKDYPINKRQPLVGPEN